jgi:hypothetical protein
MKIKTFLGLVLGQTYKCQEERTGQTLEGKVIDIGKEHAKLSFKDGTYIELNMRSDVSRCNNLLRFRG